MNRRSPRRRNFHYELTSTPDIDDAIERLAAIRERMNNLKMVEEATKRFIEDFMDEHKLHSIEGETRTCTRKHIVRKTIGKEDVPREIFNEYAREIEYTTLSIKCKPLVEPIGRVVEREQRG